MSLRIPWCAGFIEQYAHLHPGQCPEKSLKLIKSACGNLSDEEGGMKEGKLLKLKKKLRVMITEPPTAMLDENKNMVPTSMAIEELIILQL